MHVVNIYSKRVAPTALRRMRNARKREAVDNGRKKRANKAGDGLLEGFAIQLPGGMNLKTPDTERHAPPRGAEPRNARRPRLPRGRGLRMPKRPPRARRPILPQPDAAVLSAMAGLTSGFGMGPGDPRLHGRARAGRSRAGLYGPVRAAGSPRATLAVAQRS